MTTSYCFADTGFFYALVDRGDAWHAASVSVLRDVQRKGLVVMTSDFVVAETHALLLHRLGRHAALQWLDNLSEWVLVEAAFRTDLYQAYEILHHYADHEFTLTDAISFSLMRRLGIRVGLTMDRHFAAYGEDLLLFPLFGTEIP
ncbi:MAG: DNA-binding protein [Armatimonadota bacterium]|nr:MAG: DNA-binding protein [Armatimonadota bacterium]